MSEEDRRGERAARESADRLALALEDAGFDVGQDFPALHDGVGRQGGSVVHIGTVSPAVADRLVAALIGGAVSESSSVGEADDR
ncbi:hypothetical protein [Actinoplanes sp. NPDC049265]|uniref:hypothetical protein n=1 Tax=Actinoplanes sp. NPDC049265 TaxID=3363902 RepID=UPI0037237656